MIFYTNIYIHLNGGNNINTILMLFIMYDTFLMLFKWSTNKTNKIKEYSYFN